MNKNNFLTQIRWDAHVCPPFTIGADLSFLYRYINSNLDFVSLNVGFDLTKQNETFSLINYFHHWISERSTDFKIIKNVDEIAEAKLEKKLSVAFDIEGCNLLNGNLEIVSELSRLGVRQISPVYNNNNLFGGGCLDEDTGITAIGEKLIKVLNNNNILVDCSHVGYRTSMDIMRVSTYPVIFSHSNPFGLVSHPRNITDEQIQACADTGGVIGINGIGIFLGNNEISSNKIVEHIDYVVQQVGENHVGIGLDCIFSGSEIDAYVEKNPSTFPSKHGFNNVLSAEPEQFLKIEKLLRARGYSQHSVNCILGGNFARVANLVWK